MHRRKEHDALQVVFRVQKEKGRSGRNAALLAAARAVEEQHPVRGAAPAAGL